MKRILSLLLLLAATMFTTALHAQGHFDWVKNYNGVPDYNHRTDINAIVGSVADSDGNLYILGEFTPGAQIDGTDLLPFAPYGIDCNTESVVIAKLSPDGQLLWHKSIHTNYGSTTHGRGIQIVGDTSIVCMVMLSRAGARPRNYAYFLDTLFYETNDFAFPTDSVNGGMFLAYMEFGFDGHLKEKHFLSSACIYADGTVMRTSSFLYRDAGFNCEAFTIDGDGNIIMAHPVSTGSYFFDDSTFWGYRLLIDGGEKHFDVPVPAFTSASNRQIIKFSPHFTNILHQQFLFEPDMTNLDMIWPYITSLMPSGSDNSIFLLLGMQTGFDNALDSIRIAGLANTRFQSENSYEYSILIKYDSLLSPQWLFQLDYENTSDDSTLRNNYLFSAISKDENDDIYCLGRIWSLRQEQIYRADTFNINVRNGVFFVRLDKSSGQALSVGETRSYKTSVPQLLRHVEISTYNNRVIAQISYQHNIHIRDSVITRPPTMWSTGFFVWDKDGHEVQFVDYESPNSKNEPLGTIQHDSILYLSGQLAGGGTFGDHTLPEGYRAFIAKYVDSAFMTPYVYKDTTGNGGGGSTGGDTNDVRIVMAEDGNAFVAYPNPFRQRVNIEYSGQQPITAAYLTDIMGRTEQVELSATAPGRYTLDLTARPQAAYLLTLVTQDGHRHTVRLLKQSDIFGQ